jgi:hypothetical protein
MVQLRSRDRGFAWQKLISCDLISINHLIASNAAKTSISIIEARNLSDHLQLSLDPKRREERATT